ncbi:MAG: flavin monoamine oxidase family protein, partial [Myxococcota bacterium]
QVLEAEASVITLPLGVLQRAPELFEPPLPETKRTAVAGLGMGVLDKVVLRFPGVFWPEGYEHLGQAEAGMDDVGAFSNLVHHGRGPVLVGWMAGAQARALEACGQDVVVEHALRTLRRMFGRAVPEPEATWVTRWAADPFACGSYSHLPPGLDGSTYDALAEPVGRRLFFAGEHTHRAHPATTHGAYLSGLRAAREVMALTGQRQSE